LHAPPEDIARHRGRYRAGWEALRRERHARQVAAGLVDPRWALPPPDSESYDWAAANQPWEDLRMATYAAMVERMDAAIGRVLQALTEMGAAENTLVIFLSDNGGCAEDFGERETFPEPGGVASYVTVGPAWGFAQNTPFRRYKAWANEGGISAPCLVRWPGRVAPGARSDAVGHILDVVPTCLEAAGVPHPAEFRGAPPPPLEGASLMPVLRGGTRPQSPRLLWEWDGNCAVREGRWKLVWDNLNPARRWQLFDVVADRTENHDLAERNPLLVERLAAEYATWARTHGRASPGQRGAEP
jgi:arylsulfatase